MTIFYGARDELDNEPRPLWLVTRDAIGLALVAVNAVSWVLLLWAIFG